MKRFLFVRNEDETGISGTGSIAEGVVLSNGKVVVNWLTQYETLSVYPDMKTAEFLHGHDGRTVTKWLD